MQSRSIMEKRRLILASASPRRAELLRSSGIEFEQIPACINEDILPGEAPRQYVVRLARAKAGAVWRPGTRSLGADTIVVLDGDLLGKPRDAQHAKQMLRRLAGRSHHVLTGVAVFDGRNYDTLCEETCVRFGALSDRAINNYVASGEPLDKAGAYGIQGAASNFVEDIAGSYSNVVGLPIDRVSRMIR